MRHVACALGVSVVAALALLGAVGAARAEGQVRLAVLEFANTSPDRQLDSLG